MIRLQHLDLSSGASIYAVVYSDDGALVLGEEDGLQPFNDPDEPTNSFDPNSLGLFLTEDGVRTGWYWYDFEFPIADGLYRYEVWEAATPGAGDRTADTLRATGEFVAVGDAEFTAYSAAVAENDPAFNEFDRQLLRSIYQRTQKGRP